MLKYDDILQMIAINPYNNKNECTLYPNVRLTTKHVDFLYMYKRGSNCNICMKAVPRGRYVGECKRSSEEKRIVNTTYIIQLYILVRHNQNECVKDKRSNDPWQPSRISESITFWMKILKFSNSQIQDVSIQFLLCVIVNVSYSSYASSYLSHIIDVR